MMFADLPPSSSTVRFMPPAAASLMRRPTAVLPVNEIMSTSGERTSASPISAPSPFTKFTTPGGSTASTIRQSSATPSGSTGDGFTTTVLPHASAGPIFPAQFVIGKLKGVMQATTPTGSRTITPAARERPVSRGGTPCSSGAVASSAARSSRPATARTCCASATARTAPVSAMVSSTRPSISPWNRSAAVRSNAARSPPLMVRHGPRSKASRAALAAASACATEQAGAWPAISSVAGFTTGYVPPAAGTQRPPISTWSKTGPAMRCQAACAFSAASRWRVVECTGSLSNFGRTCLPNVSIDSSTYFWSSVSVKGA